ncbi:hypothetical protein BCV72DRAFT_322840 [Rhizopus microsporus var. microsporus]|uniref:Uncharacterized protein n=2 Tax=Rhizopus microsporus TaxID=58291 RepID=A0A2G4T3T4_RHIZD|nr:uncharacterized protein RHIMIDRAFT_303032 [Rhizopus microsporus ATCC 52813]ORE08781.1 hypothetical protein BCV72DRAFT_322840 [Rhizopus microsporus var. microsporus]PHZ15665.1 hypothetical protein RHIMIDRAFT_303032 [Rhizopus microsporus ATCC 52813]
MTLLTSAYKRVIGHTPRLFWRSISSSPKTIKDFPWLLSKDKPRITNYPYETTDPIMGMIPISIQRMATNWVATRILQLNTGMNYFPDQFLVGASLATRKALQLLSDQLQHPEEPREEIEHIFGPALLHRYTESAPSDANISIQLPQIYDVNVDDVWVTMGNPAAYSDDNDKYDIFRWATLQFGVNKGKNEDQESFQEYKQRIRESIIEGIQVSVDVVVDADVVYQATLKETDEILLHDEGRRDLRIRFATPYFQPANKMVRSRDSETGEPVINWNWRIVDIDQLIEKEAMDSHEEK